MYVLRLRTVLTQCTRPILPILSILLILPILPIHHSTNQENEENDRFKAIGGRHRLDCTYFIEYMLIPGMFMVVSVWLA